MVKSENDKFVIDDDMDPNRIFLWNLVHSWIEWMIDCERCCTVLQKIQCKTLTNVLWFGECLCLRHWKHLYWWWKITQTIYIPSKNTGWKISQWNRCSTYSEKLISEQSDEIYGVNTINWEDYPWKQLSLVNDEEVVSLSHAKVYVFSDSVLCFGKMSENPLSNRSGRTSWRGAKVLHNTELWTQLMVSQWNSSGLFSQDSPHCSSGTKSKSSCQKWAKNQKISQDGSSSCRCSMTSNGDLRTMNGHALLIPHLWLHLQKDFHHGRWSFFGPGSEKKWHPTHECKPQGEWDRVAELMMIKFSESGHTSLPIHESIIPRSAQKQRWWKIINTLLRWWGNDWNCFLHNHFS